MEPGAAGPVHRVGEDHQHPGQPLGDVRAAGHADPGAGLHRHPPGAAQFVAQRAQCRRINVGQFSGVFEGESRHRLRQPVGVDGAGAQDLRVGAVAKQFTDQVGQHRIVGARPRRQVAGGQPSGLGAPRVDHPQPAAVGDCAQRSGRVRHRQHVPVGHHRIAADADQELHVVVVGAATQAAEPAHQIGDQGFGGAVDGHGAESRRGADGFLQRLGAAVPGGVHADSGSEEDPDRLRPVAVDDAAQRFGEIVEAVLPIGLAQLPLDPEQGVFEPVGVMVQLRQGPTLGAGVARREWMLPVAADLQDLIAVDLDEDPADRLADPAETLDRAHRRIRHRTLLRRQAHRSRRTGHSGGMSLPGVVGGSR